MVFTLCPHCASLSVFVICREFDISTQQFKCQHYCDHCGLTWWEYENGDEK